MQEVLNRFLNAYWLRPETALWRTLDVESMKNFEFVSPSLDLGCGDGTFSFIRGGGIHDDSFDVFMDVEHLEDFYNNVDVYDSYKNTNSIQVKKHSDYMIDIGLDHKCNLMNKAANLGLYHEFVEADANRKLPFEDESFQTIFFNIIYWLNNPTQVFSEIYRILKKVAGVVLCFLIFLT